MNRWLWSKIADEVVRGVRTTKTPQTRLNTKTFRDEGQRIVAIQQNPNTGSDWARLAREGHKVVQFKDTATNKYIGVSVDGKVREY